MKQVIMIAALLMVGLMKVVSIQTAQAETTSTHSSYLPFVRYSQPVPTATPVPPTATPAPQPSFTQQVLDLTNQQRANAGCAPLTMSFQLNSAAQKHARDMSERDFFSHTGSDGSTPQSRVTNVGYFGSIGENIAAGMATPQAVVDGWMNSPGHRENILNCSFRSIGLAYIFESDDHFGPYCHYWTQVLGTQ